MRRIKINFVDFWGGFSANDNFIVKVLRKKYQVEISDTPDYLFYSTFGVTHLKYDCVKIMFVGENIVPDFNICDYALGFDWMKFEDRYMRFPLYLVSECFNRFPRKKNFEKEEMLNRKFCSIVVSNAKIANPIRERFFKLLSEYKQVDSGGRLWNNVGGPVDDKFSFVANYKFNIAFENSSVHGYTTEKIMDPMTVNTIPIYWGNPLIGEEFNVKSFINVNDFHSVEDAVEYIVKIDQNDDLYLKMLSEPWVHDFSMFRWEEKLLEFLSAIIDKPIESAKYVTNYGMQKLHSRDLMIADFFGNKLKINKVLSLWQSLKK